MTSHFTSPAANVELVRAGFCSDTATLLSQLG